MRVEGRLALGQGFGRGGVELDPLGAQGEGIQVRDSPGDRLFGGGVELGGHCEIN